MRFALRLTLAAGLTALALPALAQDAAINTKRLPVKEGRFGFEGPFGTYDRAALQRGFQVYKEVCAACHSLDHIAFHNLDEAGGPGFTEAQAKAIAAGYKIPADPNDKGELYDDKGTRLTRPGILADKFPAPYPNEEAARASNSGSLPPDLSMVEKAREGGADYVYSILTGYTGASEGTLYENPYFPGHRIAMPPPLHDGAVPYADGSPTTVDQYAADVANFLQWAADPHLESRRRLGIVVLVFLGVLSFLLWLSYKQVWRNEPH